MKQLNTLTLLVVLLCLVHTTGFTQDWDYEKYPIIDITLTHLDADIKISEDGNIDGNVTYSARFNNSFTDTLVFDAAGLDIRSVLINETEYDFYVQGDKLFIELGEGFSKPEVVTLNILYQASPRFGVHRNDYGTMWTSALPRSNSHWIPLIDHPSVTLTTDITFTHSAGKTVVATGRQNSSEIVNIDEEKTTFSSSDPVSLSSLAWAIGDFSSESSSATEEDLPQVTIFSEIEDEHSEVLETAAQVYQQISDFTGTKFPFDDLHIVILDNLNWEVKPFGSGVLFLERGQENLQAQLEAGITALWLSGTISERSWADADAFVLLQAYIMNQIFDDIPSIPANHIQPYSVFSSQNLAEWANFLNEDAEPVFIRAVETVLGQLLEGPRQTIDWQTFAGLLYSSSGRPWFDGFSPQPIQVEVTIESEYQYEARIEWTEGTGRAEVFFEAVGEPVDELVTIIAEEISFNDARTHELSFTGQSDGVVLNISSGIENIKLEIPDRDDIRLITEKPFMFWIYQVRNDDDAENRAEAAKGLATNNDNPDLQLALNDLLRTESSPEVYAEILRAMSSITQGASGTEEHYIQHTGQSQDKLVRIAAIESLSQFENSERVIGHLRSLILQSTDNDIRRTAIQSFATITDVDRFTSSVETFVSREILLNEVPLLLELLSEKGNGEVAVEIADEFTASDFPFSVRKESIELLLDTDQSSTNWSQRLPRLLEDDNPEIRFIAVQALPKLQGETRTQIIEEALMNEYDARVRRILQ